MTRGNVGSQSDAASFRGPKEAARQAARPVGLAGPPQGRQGRRARAELEVCAPHTNCGAERGSVTSQLFYHRLYIAIYSQAVLTAVRTDGPRARAQTSAAL